MERRSIEVSGVVQGVGFRPFVHSLAMRFQLRGFVRNEAGRVHIDVEGQDRALDDFLEELRDRPPPLSRIEEIRWKPVPGAGYRDFQIEESGGESGAAFVSPDVATCEECLREISDPADRRHGFAFANCTHCGPRLTIVKGAPYDRERTTMAGFEMCADCRREYEDPRDRRFHAQPICCPRCGPVLEILDADGAQIECEESFAFVASRLRAGAIVAIKGIGGFHLACNLGRVDELRRRKGRSEKPFAIMVANLEQAETLARISPAEKELLTSRARPIVILRSVREGPPIGLMLPYSPLHHLLMRIVEIPLVMTSGNHSDEPIAFEDHTPLLGIADYFLTHNRPIHPRCDDSVMRLVAGEPLPIRRSRGFAPLSISLPRALPRPMLAVGAQLKSVIALGSERRAFLSHHLGDLDHFAAYQAFNETIGRYSELCGIAPESVVHDLHPDYASTRWASHSQLPAIGVQHHHAHFASCLAENGFDEPAIGVTFDGTGYGNDGTIWGGEFLVGDSRSVERAAHLLPVPMPGGEKAIREPWRMAVAHLRSAGLPVEAEPALLRMIDRGVNSPLTSSMGRLFDAAAAIAGLRREVTYEGQAAIEFEWAASSGSEPPYPFDLLGGVIDTRPLIRALAADRSPLPIVSRRFHSTVAEIVLRTSSSLRNGGAPKTVALSGGVFMNAILLEECSRRLGAAGFKVLRHTQVPPNDGGIALGQLACAAAME